MHSADMKEPTSDFPPPSASSFSSSSSSGLPSPPAAAQALGLGFTLERGGSLSGLGMAPNPYSPAFVQQQQQLPPYLLQQQQQQYQQQQQQQQQFQSQMMYTSRLGAGGEYGMHVMHDTRGGSGSMMLAGMHLMRGDDVGLYYEQQQQPLPVSTSPTRQSVVPGKMFVGGLSPETTKDRLKEHFQAFGEVIDCVVMTDPTTGRTRGFGFVTFRDGGRCEHVLRSRPHIIDGREVDPKMAVPREDMENAANGTQHHTHHHGDRAAAAAASMIGGAVNPLMASNGAPSSGPQQGSSGGNGGGRQRGISQSNGSVSGAAGGSQGGRGGSGMPSQSRKVFVGGLPPNATDDLLKSFFARFGNIDEAVVIHDKQTRLPRGFGFVTFTDEYTADSVVSVHFHEFMGKMVEVKRAEPKPASDTVVSPGVGLNPQAAPVSLGAGSQRGSLTAMLGQVPRVGSPTLSDYDDYQNPLSPHRAASPMRRLMQQQQQQQQQLQQQQQQQQQMHMAQGSRLVDTDGRARSYSARVLPDPSIFENPRRPRSYSTAYPPQVAPPTVWSDGDHRNPYRTASPAGWGISVDSPLTASQHDINAAGAGDFGLHALSLSDLPPSALMDQFGEHRRFGGGAAGLLASMHGAVGTPPQHMGQFQQQQQQHMGQHLQQQMHLHQQQQQQQQQQQAQAQQQQQAQLQFLQQQQQHGLHQHHAHHHHHHPQQQPQQHHATILEADPSPTTQQEESFVRALLNTEDVWGSNVDSQSASGAVQVSGRLFGGSEDPWSSSSVSFATSPGRDMSR